MDMRVRVVAVAVVVALFAAGLYTLFIPGPPRTVFHARVDTGLPHTRFVVEVPAPVLSDETLAAFLRTVPEQTGVVEFYTFVVTEAGVALRIQGEGTVSLTWRSSGPIQGPWPLPPGERHPAGNPDLSMWTEGPFDDGTMGSSLVHVEAADGQPFISAQTSIEFSRGDCQVVMHRVRIDEVTAPGWYSSAMEAITARCL